MSSASAFDPAADVLLAPADLSDGSAPLRVPTPTEALTFGPSPHVGGRHDVGGISHREVTFRCRGAYSGDAVMLHLNGLTDRHRENITPALCEWHPSGVHALTYLLPEDGCWSYRFVVRDHIPADIGATRPGWVGVHRDGRCDPDNTDHIPDPHGGDESSVYRGPGWIGHPAWNEARAQTTGRSGEADGDSAADWITLDGDDVVTAGAGAARLRVGDPGADTPLLILLDGAWWARLNLEAALAARHRQTGRVTPHVLQVHTGEKEDRWEILGSSVRCGRAVEAAVGAAAPHLPAPPSPRRTVVAGQSLGGLAAATILMHRPDLAAQAIAQSGSFWLRAGVEPQRHGGFTPGDLLTELTEQSRRGITLPGRRLVVQVGRDEDDMVDGSRAATAAARALGIPVAHRECRGGHDFAWWTDGLFHGLDLVEM